MPRTDEEIKKDVIDQIFWDDSVNAADVKAEVLDGRGTLTGTAPSYTARASVVRDAWAVVGVRDVDNQVAVQLPSDLKVPKDEEIRASARSILQWKTDLDDTKIQIDVQGGIVTLKGTVDTFWKRFEAEEALVDLGGVIELVNELAVVPTLDVEDELIARDVEKALDRNLLVDPDQVTVEVTNSKVTLTGTVPSLAARRAASDVATYTRGVVDVENDLLVAA